VKPDTVIQVENLSKCYRINAPVSAAHAKSPFRYLQSTFGDPSSSELFWALDGVSFEVKRGEVLGLIGRNGAGKSTLLKILSRITEPTTGRAEIQGRVRSLLEVGTGFHPELTGRENIYLNGTVLGMRRWEIDRKFNAIVEFAEMEQFLETPVKRYSSGMYTRLAFSVAAHLEPDILIVDEVLAVGDVAFQRKCLDKMEEVTSHGRTILFVSHNMSAVNRLCQSAMLLERGQLVEQGEVDQVVRRYLAGATESPAEWCVSREEAVEVPVYLKHVRVLGENGHISDVHSIDAPIRVAVEYVCESSLEDLHVEIQVLSDTGEVLFASADHLVKSASNMRHKEGHYQSTCCIPPNLLAEGRHSISVILIDLYRQAKYAVHRNLVSFWVRDRCDGTTVRGLFPGHWSGLVRPMLSWTVDELV
jgi:homopolymeric O-antigen transport system ATP-binding protein